MATFTVTTHLDEASSGATATQEANDGDGLSLREAIALANENGGADTITFAAGGQGLIRLTKGEISITDELTIDGGGLVTITGDAGANDTTLEGGITAVSASAPADNLGDNTRIFLSTKNLTLDGLTLTGGSASTGGAVYAGDNLTIRDSILAGNSASIDGGAVSFADLSGSLTITKSEFRGNVASRDGGAIAAGYSSTDTLTIAGSTFNDNVSGARGGAVASEVVVTTVNGSMFNSNSSTGAGGALFAHNFSRDAELTITDSTISENMTSGSNAKGGGIHADTTNLTITNSAVVGNYTTGDSAFGGGIYVEGTYAGSFEDYAGDINITNSTISNNETRGERGYGGGIFVDGGEVLVENSTITGNNALGSLNDPDTFEIGAAIYSDNDITIRNSIVTGNTAPTAGGPEIKEKDQTGRPSGIDDVIGNGVVTFEGANIIGADASAYDVSAIANAVNAAPSDIFDGDVRNNGGDIVTIALKADLSNLALDAVTISGTDARGEARGVDFGGVDNGGASDIGAFELQLNEDTSPPVITSGLNFSVAEGLSSALSLTPVPATDLQAVTFSISGGVDADKVSINVSTGVLSFSIEPDFEIPADANGDNTFDVIVQVSDGDNSIRQSATISITNVSEAPADPSAGDDTLLGTALNDTINALAGNDQVNGLAGDDLLIGGGGDDSIRGAAGDDRLRGNRGEDILKGCGGNDNIKGNGGADVVRGNGGDDVIRAGGDDDNVKGGGGNDLIFGGGGADKLNGGGGADTLKGNGGDDTLKGNGGADVFQFRTSDRNDTIADFRQGQDKIQIQNGVQTFEGLSIEQDGHDVLIGFGAGQVRVVTDNAGAFDESDFIF